MKHLIWIALLLSTACGGPTGPSVEDLTKAKEEARGFRPWADFEAALPATLGEAKKDGDSWSWAAKDGDKCKILTVTKMGDNVGNSAIADGPCP